MSFRFRAALIAALTMAALPGPAFADAAKAKTCRDGLAPQGQQMFDATAPHVQADSALPDLLRKHVRGLVMGGKLSRSEAQSNAQAVGACLKLLQG